MVFLLISPCSGQPSEPRLLERMEAAREATEVQPLLETVARALGDGELFGQERAIARATLRFWEDPATPPQVLLRLQEIYGMIAPAVAVMDPPLAETLLVRVPLRWLASDDPERRQLAPEVLRWAWETADDGLRRLICEALPSALERVASYDDESFEAVLKLLAEDLAASWEIRFSGSYPKAFLERLRAYRGPLAWKLPEILALDGSDTGTEALIFWALNPPPLPPDAARWTTAQRERELFLQKLEGRSLSLDQKRRVVELIREPELRGEVLRWVREWVHRREPLPPLPPESLPLLEQLALEEGTCYEAVRLLAAVGPAGVARLFPLAEADGQAWDAPIRNPRPCEGERWSALFEHAEAIAHRIGQAYRENPAPWHLQLLARAGRWELIFKALQSPDSRLRREAAFILALALAPEEEEAAHLGDDGHGRRLAESLAQRPDLQRRAREALGAALKDEDPHVQREALRALLQLGDPLAPAHLLAALGKEEAWFQSLISGWRPALTESLALQLARTAWEDKDPKVRIRALEVLGRAQPGHWQIPVEAELRPLLQDPDENLRRYVVQYYFASVPARDPATAAALLEATGDVSKDVRHFAGMALGVARGWRPELVARLEARLKQGDADENVVGQLEAAYLHALRQEPGAVDRLLAIILRQEGPARWRRALAAGPAAEPAVAQALQDRLAPRPLVEWAPMPKVNIKEWLSSLGRGEEDPPPLSLILNLVPVKQRDPWLVQKVLADQKASLEHRLWLLLEVGDIPQELQDGVWNLWLQALKEEKGGERLLRLLGRWKFAGLRRLMEVLWDDPDNLRKAAGYLRKQEQLGKRRGLAGQMPGVDLPGPTVEDLPWIEATLARIPAGSGDPRLETLVDLMGLGSLGNDPHLRRKAFRTRIPELLYRHLSDPRECRWVAAAVGSLHGRMVPPRCPSSLGNSFFDRR
jgi:HEAT repeat protein